MSSSSVMGLPSHMSGFLHQLGPPSSGVYSYVSYPTVLPSNRPRYRNDQASPGSSTTGLSSTGGAVNIMHDRRVVRGNTYARNNAHLRNNWNVNSTADDALMRQRQHERNGYVKKRMLPSIGSKANSTLSNGYIPGSSRTGARSDDLRADRLLSSEARYTAARARVRKRLAQYQRDQGGPANGLEISGGSRKHLTVQTEQWLEEIKDRLPEVEVGVQTDETGQTMTGGVAPSSSAAASAAGESASAPLRDAFPPLDPGVDKSTQILPDDPDLFAFDEEVGIVLDAMVSKTLEQSLLEVIDEEEVAAMDRMAKMDISGSRQQPQQHIVVQS